MPLPLQHGQRAVRGEPFSNPFAASERVDTGAPHRRSLGLSVLRGRSDADRSVRLRPCRPCRRSPCRSPPASPRLPRSVQPRPGMPAVGAASAKLRRQPKFRLVDASKVPAARRPSLPRARTARSPRHDRTAQAPAPAAAGSRQVGSDAGRLGHGHEPLVSGSEAARRPRRSRSEQPKVAALTPSLSP